MYERICYEHGNVKRAYAFLKTWKCKDPEKDLPVEYASF